MNTIPTPNSLPPDFATLFKFEEVKTKKTFGVSLATLLQCLCIAEQRHLVPPFEAAWEAISIPKTLREMSKNPPRFP